MCIHLLNRHPTATTFKRFELEQCYCVKLTAIIFKIKSSNSDLLRQVFRRDVIVLHEVFYWIPRYRKTLPTQLTAPSNHPWYVANFVIFSSSIAFTRWNRTRTLIRALRSRWWCQIWIRRRRFDDFHDWHQCSHFANIGLWVQWHTFCFLLIVAILRGHDQLLFIALKSKLRCISSKDFIW